LICWTCIFLGQSKPKREEREKEIILHKFFWHEWEYHVHQNRVII
jgi:hypothetical protein